MTSSGALSLPLLPRLDSSLDLFSEKIEPYDLFSTVTRSGETILYEAIGEIVRIAIFAYANYDESCELIGPGKLTIIFYPTLEEIRVILQPRSHFWPVRNERIEDNQDFDYDGWFWREDGRDRMCKNRQDLADNERERGFIFGDWNYYGISFGTEDQVIELKTIIRSIQARISIGIPKTSPQIIQDSLDVRLSRFWCCTGLRASNLKILGLHTGSLWRINGSYSVEHDRHGMIALASKKDTPGLVEMIVIFRTANGDEIEDVRKCYKIPSSLKLVLSHITPENKKDLVWEWIIEGEMWACGFRNDTDAQSFKAILDSYVSDLKKSSKKFFARK